MSARVAIRVEATPQIGIGHFTRSLALAQEWKAAGYEVVFVMSRVSTFLREQLRASDIQVVETEIEQIGGDRDAQRTVQIAEQEGARWIIVDGYAFGADYQYALKQSDFTVLCIDDYGHAAFYWADFVINQNISACESLYSNRASYTKLLLGPRYVLLRRNFLRWRQWKRNIPSQARKVLITLGGFDPDSVLPFVVHTVSQRVQGVKVKVVTTTTNPAYTELRQYIQRYRTAVELLVDVKDVAPVMAWADVAISGGGSTCWELAFMGLPNLVIILSDNQQPIAEELHARGISISLGWYTDISPETLSVVLESLLKNPKQRSLMAQQGRELIDGQGARRVIQQVIKQAGVQ